MTTYRFATYWITTYGSRTRVLCLTGYFSQTWLKDKSRGQTRPLSNPGPQDCCTWCTKPTVDSVLLTTTMFALDIKAGAFLDGVGSCYRTSIEISAKSLVFILPYCYTGGLVLTACLDGGTLYVREGCRTHGPFEATEIACRMSTGSKCGSQHLV